MQPLIVPYDAEWKIAFQKISEVISKALKDFPVTIEHVGSTAVPGLFAKPIIDIDIVIDNKDALGAVTAILEKLGYASKGDQGVAGRFAFRQTAEPVPLTDPRVKWGVHHLYVCYADSLPVKNHLVFRDALRKDDALRDSYAALKKSLAADPAMTRAAYAVQKTAFIISVLALKGFDKNELEEITRANT